MNFDKNEKMIIKDVLSTIGQVFLIYVVAFLWFMDGVKRVWSDVISNTAAGKVLIEIGTNEKMTAKDDEVAKFASMSAVLHTAIICVGLWLGHYYKKGVKSNINRDSEIWAAVASCFIMCFAFLSVTFTQKTEAVFTYANFYFKDTAGVVFAVVGAVSMTTWLGAAILVSQIDDNTKGIYPAVISPYCKIWATIACFAVFFFKALVVPIWNLSSSYGLIPYSEVADYDFDTPNDFESSFVRMACSTHILVFITGMVWVITGSYLFGGKRTTRELVILGTLGWLFLMLLCVRVAVAAQMSHLLDFTTRFFGEHLNYSEVFIISVNYTGWFVAGSCTELGWKGSYTNRTEQQKQESTSGSDSFSKQQNLDLVIGVFIFLGLCLTALPFIWTSVFLFVLGLAVAIRSEPDIDIDEDIERTKNDGFFFNLNHGAKGSHETSLSRWDMILQGFSTTLSARHHNHHNHTTSLPPPTKYSVIGSGPVADSLIETLSDRDNVKIQREIGLNADVVFFVPDRNNLTYESVVGQALELRRVPPRRAPKLIVMCANIGVNPATIPTEKSYSEWVLTEAEKVILQEGVPAVSIRVPGEVFGEHSGTFLDRILDNNAVYFPSPCVVKEYVYVKNVVLGMLQAEARLTKTPETVSGRCFYLTNEEPNTYKTLVDILANYKPGLTVFQWPKWAKKLFVIGCVKTNRKAWLNTTVSRHEVEITREVLGYIPCFSLEDGIQFAVDAWDVKQARREVEEASVLLETKKRKLAAIEGLIGNGKMKPVNPPKKIASGPVVKPVQTVPKPPQKQSPTEASLLVNPITGNTMAKDPSQVAKTIFAQVMAELASLLTTISPSLPIVCKDAKGYDIIFPIPLKLSSHLTDFLRKRLNPKLKEDPLFKGSCIRVNLQPPASGPHGEQRLHPPQQHSVYAVDV
eukprot:TRINITY_DN7112_c0_g1_i1.p1 TRINITY_DN7112_c0_g1~~TRINITY_DN7112_c0_g1_i1.p1  ORF type:complete len:925 (+),score=153.12 TRINITY_DN7112_c0_g1_i1:25-2775(+)